MSSRVDRQYVLDGCYLGRVRVPLAPCIDSIQNNPLDPILSTIHRPCVLKLVLSKRSSLVNTCCQDQGARALLPSINPQPQSGSWNHITGSASRMCDPNQVLLPSHRR